MLQYLDIPNYIKEFISKSLNKINGLHSVKMKNNLTQEVKDWLSENNLTPSEVKYLIDNNLNEIPKCLHCGKRVKNFHLGYLFCCKECALKSDYRTEKIKETNLERYGGVAPICNINVQKKTRKTCIERYGVISFSQTDEYKKKYKNTCIERYGVTNPNKLDSVQDKIKETNLERYGVENPQQNTKVKEKTKKTNLERYNSEYFMGTDDFKNKSEETLIKNYGVTNVMKVPEIREKCKVSFKKSNYSNNVKKLKEHNIIIEMSEEEYFNSKIIDYRCLICNNTFKSIGLNWQRVHCPYCLKYSSIEKDVLAFIQNIYSGEIITHDRNILNPYEIDIYIPNKHLAIECNGDYWHSTTKNTNEYYHQEKTLNCKKQGIRLIHIFEYEWNNKKDICKSIIKSALGIYDRRIYARNCVVKDISANDYRNFLEVNHLQGFISSSIRYGLYYQEELVSVIGFGKSRFKKNEIELHRFCCKLNYSVIGAFSKLIKHSGVNNFITYVDLAHFTGDGYKKIGFEEIAITKPNYKWINHNIVLNRFSTQKHKLVKLLMENYNPDLTEDDNMLDNGYNKVYDSGNIKMVYKGM